MKVFIGVCYLKTYLKHETCDTINICKDFAYIKTVQYIWYIIPRVNQAYIRLKYFSVPFLIYMNELLTISSCTIKSICHLV